MTIRNATNDDIIEKYKPVGINIFKHVSLIYAICLT